MLENNVVKVDSVSMCFNMSTEKIDSLKEYVIKLFKRQLLFKEFWALSDVSFNVRKGEIFGIIGLNGAGKSTILKVIAGVLKPTIGKATVLGSMAPLIELGAGFDMELTARENVFLNGAILGHAKKLMQEKFNEIVDFSELHEFLDVPVKNYSSGMVARLAFAIATVVQPDILIVDEILSVGDFQFRKKCQDKIESMIKGGTTVIMVSHSIEQMEEMCDRVVWLEHGKIKMLGKTSCVTEVYKNS